MPKVDLTATKDFTYMTRRLTAGDPFQARNPLEAKILTRVRKVAEAPSDADAIRSDMASFETPKPVVVKTGKPRKPAVKKATGKRKAKAKKD